MDRTELAKEVVRIARQAGAAIMAVYAKEEVGIEFKPDESPLTLADRASNEVICAGLAALPVQYPVVSEENKAIPFGERRAYSFYWLVDPLDGTKEFIKRNGEFTVNIALMERDHRPISPLGSHTPAAAALYVPVKDTLYFAWPGGGAFMIAAAGTRGIASALELAAPARRLPLPMSRDIFTIVASRSHASPDTDAFIQRMMERHGEVALTSMGSALKICLVAEGAADVYPRYAPTMEWDTAAGHAICREAGRDIIDVTTNEPMRYNKASLVNNWFIAQEKITEHHTA